ncbi:transcriptional repressor NsrR [Stieleria bergensis]|uniref:Transcriptional repressor NsrR n=2 Tax=Stieleria bergensis TaxID=2528025 RepID=A0A517SX10_9BACT|nr:transcriptional repressor NsrR [Planctomycetes bacterium SV_7m_r]
MQVSSFSSQIYLGPHMLSKTAEYALRAVVSMASQYGKPQAADRMAKHTKVPRRYLTRVLQDLAASGLVRSRPGPGGGYELNRPTDEITVLQVINTVSPLRRIDSCTDGLEQFQEMRSLHNELDRAFSATEATFAALTIQSLLENNRLLTPRTPAETPAAGVVSTPSTTAAQPAYVPAPVSAPPMPTPTYPASMTSHTAQKPGTPRMGQVFSRSNYGDRSFLKGSE